MPARKRKPERNLPRTISWSFTGDEVSSTMVPLWRSSAMRRIERNTLAIMVRPAV
jgi:hypothetical protein